MLLLFVCMARTPIPRVARTLSFGKYNIISFTHYRMKCSLTMP